MGGCANSKYAVDEDKKPKKDKKPLINKKNKGKKDEPATATTATPAVDAADTVPAKEHDDTVKENGGEAIKVDDHAGKHAAPKADDIEFIDKEEAEKQQAAAAAAAAAAGAHSAATHTTDSSVKTDDDTKKEVTTYQTTVVKHTQKEGDELLQHLKDEAFRTLQNLLRQQQESSTPPSPTQTTSKTTASSSANSTPQTTSGNEEDIVAQIKLQVVASLGRSRQDLIYSIIDTGAGLIRENKVKSMGELQTALEAHFPDTPESDNNAEVVKKVINATTGFLTAKGTEAGALLSNILANVNGGIQGVMNEVEKTTVKVTRTVTEQILSGGQLKEVTRVVTSNVPAGGSSNMEDVLKNLSNGLGVDGSPFSSETKVVNSGTTTTASLTTEKHEVMAKDKLTNGEGDETKRQAHEVVTHAVNAAVEKVIDESKLSNGDMTNGHHHYHETTHNGLTELTEENIKVEEESTIRTSTTKIVVNGSGNTSNNLEQVQGQFYKHGKQAAEVVVKKLNGDTNGTSHVSEPAAATS